VKSPLHIPPKSNASPNTVAKYVQCALKSAYHGENTFSYIKQSGIDIVVAPPLSQGIGGNGRRIYTKDSLRSMCRNRRMIDAKERCSEDDR
jgi:hypothetical protein